jgi:hypothetical protein
MITTVILKGKELKVITQQYVVGCYVAVYKQDHAIPDQMGIDIPEKDFHIEVRNGKFFKGKVKVIAEKSSVI